MRGITFVYLGGDCDETTNDQEGKAECDGDEMTEAASLVITKDANKFVVEPSGVIQIGDVVSIIKFENGQIKDFPSEIEFELQGENGQLQEHVLHTSCSKPLNLGDRFRRRRGS